MLDQSWRYALDAPVHQRVLGTYHYYWSITAYLLIPFSIMAVHEILSMCVIIFMALPQHLLAFGWSSSGPELRSYVCKSFRFAINMWAVTHTQRYFLKSHLDCLNAKYDWQIYSVRSVIMKLMTFAEETLTHLKGDKLWFFFQHTFMASGFWGTSNSHLMIGWNSLLCYSHNSTDAIHHAIGLPQKLLMSRINSHYLIC